MNTTVKNLFNQFCKVYNLRTREYVTLKSQNTSQLYFYSHDFIKMDYVPIYGGYVMIITHMGTSQSHFDSATRLTSKEMIAYLKGLLAAENKYIFENIIK